MLDYGRKQIYFDIENIDSTEIFEIIYHSNVKLMQQLLSES